MRILVVAADHLIIQQLEQALRNMANEMEVLQKPMGGYRRRFLVKQGQKLQSVDIQDICYFFSEERFIFFRTRDNQKYLIEYRIEELEQMLDPSLFFRVNRAFLVSIKAIEQVYPYYGNRLKLLVSPPAEKDIIVSRDRVAGFRVWMGE